VIVDVYQVTEPGADAPRWRHDVYPILALEWTVDAEGERSCKPVFFMPWTYGLAVCNSDDMADFASYASASCAVSCPWPESEDGERLKPYVEALIPKAIAARERRAKAKAEKKAAREAPPGGYFEKALAIMESQEAEESRP
jgi:hypothetical protein